MVFIESRGSTGRVREKGGNWRLEWIVRLFHSGWLSCHPGGGSLTPGSQTYLHLASQHLLSGHTLAISLEGRGDPSGGAHAFHTAPWLLWGLRQLSKLLRKSFSLIELVGKAVPIILLLMEWYRGHRLSKALSQILHHLILNNFWPVYSLTVSDGLRMVI